MLPASPSALAVADLNGDRYDDIVTATVGTTTRKQGGVNIMLGNGNGGFRVQQPITLSVPTNSGSSNTDTKPTAVIAADFDGDGLMTSPRLSRGLAL